MMDPAVLSKHIEGHSVGSEKRPLCLSLTTDSWKSQSPVCQLVSSPADVENFHSTVPQTVVIERRLLWGTSGWGPIIWGSFSLALPLFLFLSPSLHLCTPPTPLFFFSQDSFSVCVVQADCTLVTLPQVPEFWNEISYYTSLRDHFFNQMTHLSNK